MVPYFISLNHLQFPLSMFYSSPYLSLLPPWSGFFLGILCYLFGGNFKRDFFFFFLLSLPDISMLTQRNVSIIGFCMLLLCPTTLVNLFINSNSCCAEFICNKRQKLNSNSEL